MTGLSPVSGILARVKEGAETMGGIIQARAGGVGPKAAGESRKGQYRAAGHARQMTDVWRRLGTLGMSGGCFLLCTEMRSILATAAILVWPFD